VDFHTPWGKVAILLIIAVVLAALFSRVRWRLDEVAFVVLALYFSLTYIRFLFLAGILLAPIFAKRLKLMTPYESSSDRRLNNAIALLLLFCLFVASVPRRSTYENPVKYPDGAIAYMRANGIQGRIFNDWVWGGYLIWYMPQVKVFVDGREHPYVPTGVVNDYLAATSSQSPQPVLDKYRIEYVLMPVDSPMAKSLMVSPGWLLSYSDETSVLLHRSQ
jgi:signal transduction histidine kinase